MDFISNSSEQQEEMLKAIGVASIEELFSAIPEAIRLAKRSEEDGLSELEGMRLMESIASQNSYYQFDSYLGAGAYAHHVPALVAAICSKSEFLTSYTPYQPEASQGMLQVIFEFQTAICALTGMDVSNASLYDGASACAEAVLMSLRINKSRNKILVAKSVHPHYKEVIQQYAGNNIVEVPYTSDNSIDHDAFNQLLIADTALFLLQSPNVFGLVEEAKKLFSLAHEKGVITILCANPLSYGLFASAAEVGADIAVGDCQPFGLPLNFGGPYAGYLACKKEFMRQLPGRIVGETKDAEGKRGYVLTLQAREQHIRREKATSNVCTNQALAALASLVAILWYGKKGVAELALTNYQRAAYLRQQLSAIPGVKAQGNNGYFNEFVLAFDKPIEDTINYFKSKGILPGFPLKEWYPSHKNSLLVCVTELKTKAQLDHYVEVSKSYAKHF